MKYAFMSDIHSNPVALKAALDDARALGCGRFAFLGDVTGYGYDVFEALKMLKENFNTFVLGNHDAISSGIEDDMQIRANRHYDVDRDQGRLLSEEDRAWFRSLKYVHRNPRSDFAVTHGDFVMPERWGYITNEEEARASFLLMRERLLLCGHLHHAMVFVCSKNGRQVKEIYRERLEDPAGTAESVTFKLVDGCRYLVNCGSVGNPRYDLCTTYAVYDTLRKKVTIRRLPFDFKGYIMSMLAAKVPLPEWVVLLLSRARSLTM